VRRLSRARYEVEAGSSDQDPGCRIFAAFNHQNIGATYELVETDNARFLVLELVEGKTLDEVIASRGAKRLDDALRIAAQICDALSAADEKGPPPCRYIAGGKTALMVFVLHSP
jgi:serine/threonine protein kinase